jgi:glutathione S-transferase
MSPNLPLKEMTMIQLYDATLSGNCHKVRTMLGLLGHEYQSIAVDLAAGEQKAPAFLALNPFGQVPVIKDGDSVIRDSQAILVYLARRYGGQRWWPDDAAALGAIAAWLSTAASEVAQGPGALRLHHKFGRVINVEQAQRVSRSLLATMDFRLSANDWIGTDTASIADIAMYPYIALAHEGQVDLAPYPSIIAWVKRVQAMPGYVGMPGI